MIMVRRKKLLSGVLLLSGMLCTGRVMAQQWLYKQAAVPIEYRVKDLLGRMTIEEKVGQLCCPLGWEMYTKTGKNEVTVSELYKKKMAEAPVGSFWAVLRADPWTQKTLETGLSPELSAKALNALQKYAVEETRLGIPVLFAEECPHGHRAIGTTVFPTALSAASTWNEGLLLKMGEAIALEARLQGANIGYGPVLDVAREPRWSRMEETFGEDPVLTTIMGVAMMKGMQGKVQNDGKHLYDTLKHCAAYGVPESGHNGSRANCGMRQLLSEYLPPFRKAVKEGAGTLMTSYNAIDGVPCTANKELLTDVLRNEWGFKGYVYSDWGAVAMLKDFQHTAKDDSEAAIQALTAGVDLEASSNCYWALEQLIEQGRFDEKYVDLAVGRILRVKFELGLFENPYQGADMPGVAMRTKEAVELSRRVADESIVLLKNENTLLPLNLNKIKSLAVIGPNANQVQFGDYTWSRSNKDGVTPLEGLKKRVGNKIKINYAAGCDLITDNKSGFDEAVAAVKASDMAVVFVGSSSASLARDYSDATCGEGFDLSSLDLTGVQEELVEEIYAIGKPVIVVLVTGKPFSISWIKEHIPAIVVQWYGGEKAGDAIADMLLGNINPSAKLPFSFPQSVGHLPVFYNHLPTDKGFYRRPGRPNEPGRDYVFSSPAPLWSFGHGLSYTTFEYLNAHYSAELLHPSDTLIVSVSLKNTGSVAGKEVVQLYVRDVVSSVVTPVKQLKAFSKPFLQPGEMQTVVLKLPIQELALYDLSMKKVVEEGEYEIQIGTASDDIRLRRTIFVGRQPVTSNSLGHNDFCMDEIVKNPGRKIKVAGCVRDVQATPISGIEIKSNYSGRTVISKEGGRYSILTVENDVLTISAKGFETVNIKVNKQKDIDIKLNYSHD